MTQDMAVILDLGSEESARVAREVRSLGVYSEIHPHDITLQQLSALGNVRALIPVSYTHLPYCGMMLADMGAEVTKIELPGRGDDSRRNFPIVNGESAYFMNLNRNKRGMTLNLKSEKGKEIFRELVKQSDIVLENYRPGVMEKLGLGYEDLKKINPAIIYGAVSGFGHYGPYSKRAGYDIIGQAMSCLLYTSRCV